MTEAEVKKKKKKSPKKKRKATPITKLICVLALAASGYFLYNIGTEVMTTLTLSTELAEVEEKYQRVLDENAKLTKEKAKLEDPDYVTNYARETYLVSKDGEQIFYLPEDDNR